MLWHFFRGPIRDVDRHENWRWRRDETNESPAPNLHKSSKIAHTIFCNYKADLTALASVSFTCIPVPLPPHPILPATKGLISARTATDTHRASVKCDSCSGTVVPKLNAPKVDFCYVVNYSFNEMRADGDGCEEKVSAIGVASSEVTD